MTKKQAINICSFIENHYDSVSQVEWFDFCDIVLDVVVRDAALKGYGEELLKRFPGFFEIQEV